LLDNFTKEKLLQATYKEVMFTREPVGWTSETKNRFIDQNYELIKAKLLQLNSKDCDYSIFHDGLNPYIYESAEYRNYFNNCGEPKSWIYPTKTIVISYSDNGNSHQDHIDFLRTDNGYKLFAVNIGVGK
jgi:hypothetical protein